MDAARTLPGKAPPARVAWRVTPLRLVAALILLALAVRLNGLALRPLWLDEGYSAWFVGRSWHELWTIVPTYEPHPPFYYSLLKLWSDLAGSSAVALRSFSVLVSILTIPVAVAASSELERQHPTGRPLLSAGVAGFLAACSPMFLLLDQEARPYPLLIFGYAIAVWGLVRLLGEFAERKPGRWSSWAMLAAGAELTLWAHGLGVLYAVCLALALAPAWLKPPADRRRVARGMLAAAAVALLYLPCLLMILGRAGDWGTGWLSWEWVKLLELLTLYSVPYELLTVGSAVAALAVLLLAKRGIQSALQGQGWTSGKAILLLWSGPPLMAIAISILFMPVFLPRTLAPTLVPAYLAIGAAVARINSRQERHVLLAALALPLLVTAVQVGRRPPAEQWGQVASYLRQHVATGDQVWLYPNDSALPLRSAGAGNLPMRGIPGDYPAVGFKGPIRAGSPAVVSLTAPQARQIAYAGEAQRIWLVTRQSALFDPRGDLPRALAEVRRPGRLEQWGYISVQPYDLKR
jgi:uncharacterized membrane protein